METNPEQVEDIEIAKWVIAQDEQYGPHLVAISVNGERYAPAYSYKFDDGESANFRLILTHLGRKQNG